MLLANGWFRLARAGRLIFIHIGLNFVNQHLHFRFRFNGILSDRLGHGVHSLDGALFVSLIFQHLDLRWSQGSELLFDDLIDLIHSKICSLLK